MEKTYVLDTSVLLQTPYALEAFEDNQIVLPIAVLEELDVLKGAEGEQGTNARQAIRRLEALRAQGISIGSTTGYTDKMMAVVTQGAARQGYAPDAWFSPRQRPGPGPAVSLHDLCQHGPVPSPLRSRCGEGGGHGRGH